MKTLVISLVLSFLATVSHAGDVQVNGYYRSNGTYVAPHTRSAPDGDRFNNYSTEGNSNPYTGRSGTQNPYNTQPFGGSRNILAPTDPNEYRTRLGG